MKLLVGGFIRRYLYMMTSKRILLLLHLKNILERQKIYITSDDDSSSEEGATPKLGNSVLIDRDIAAKAFINSKIKKA